MPNEKSFWGSVPGILTGLAAVITAVGGTVAIYYQVRPKASSPPPNHIRNEGGPCSRTFPDFGEVPRTRVLYFRSDESARGAEVYLNGKCQGYLGNRLSGRLENNMLVNVPPGNYEIQVRKKGYNDFRTTLTVPPSDTPPGLTPKVLVQFELAPIQR